MPPKSIAGMIKAKAEKKIKEKEIEKQIQNTDDNLDDDDLEREFQKMLDSLTPKATPSISTNDSSRIKYKIPEEIKFNPIKMTSEEYGPYGTQWVHDEQTDDILGDDEIRRSNQLDALMSIVYPEQRSEAWFKMRNDKITASDGGTVVGINKNEPQYKFILKKVVGAPFQSNEFCYHGKKYEKIATMVYENRMNVKVEEFGLVGHPTIDHLGASPDGIIGKYKLDGKHLTKFVGRMLEIKCPLVRKIKMDGDIKDNICPIYYWAQVQLQLQCCLLDECDFWQCELIEYRNRQDFINDTNPDEPFRSLTNGNEKGCLIQLIPMDRVKDVKDGKYLEVIYDTASFIYPPSIEMSPHDLDQWVLETIQNLSSNPLYKDYVLDKVIYWRIGTNKSVTIYRDDKWFDENKPILEKHWKQVEYFRNNQEKTKILTDFIDSLLVKSNTKIMNIIDDIMNNPIDSRVIKNILKSTADNKIKKEESIKRKADKESLALYMYDDILAKV